MNPTKIDCQPGNLVIFEKLIALSVELHNLNAGVQKNYELSIVQWLVLKKILEHPGISAGSLAEISGVHPSTLTPTINRLQTMGHIHILERPSDLRRKFIVASWGGFEACSKSEDVFKKILEHVCTDEGVHAECDRVMVLIRSLAALV